LSLPDAATAPFGMRSLVGQKVAPDPALQFAVPLIVYSGSVDFAQYSGWFHADASSFATVLENVHGVDLAGQFAAMYAITLAELYLEPHVEQL
jgi:hypothetical protein